MTNSNKFAVQSTKIGLSGFISLDFFRNFIFFKINNYNEKMVGIFKN